MYGASHQMSNLCVVSLLLIQVFALPSEAEPTSPYPKSRGIRLSPRLEEKEPDCLTCQPRRPTARHSAAAPRGSEGPRFIWACQEAGKELQVGLMCTKVGR
jgi:hypothetical protein